MTELVYLQAFDVIKCDAVVLSVTKLDDERTDVVLDRTCLYPRGGGQDWDTGKINEFAVDEVRLDEEGTVHHMGHGRLGKGQKVHIVVDKERRNRNSRLHSAGHVIDMAVNQLGLPLIPGKGAHYPHMSFVEYVGTAEDAEAVQQALQEIVMELLDRNISNTIKFVTEGELKQLCRHVPDNIPTNKPVRVVLYGDFGVPCGGTHVANLKDVGKIEITKVKAKKGLTKVSYRVDGIEA